MKRIKIIFTYPFSSIFILLLLPIFLMPSRADGAKWDYVFSANLSMGNKFQDKFNTGLSLMNSIGSLDYQAEDGSTKQYTSRVMQRNLFRGFTGIGGSFLFGVNNLHFFGINFTALFYSSTEIVYHLVDENENKQVQEQLALNLTATPIQLQYKYKISAKPISFFIGGGFGYFPVSMECETNSTENLALSYSSASVGPTFDLMIAYDINTNFSIFTGLGTIFSFPLDEVKLDGSGGPRYFVYQKNDSVSFTKKNGDKAQIKLDSVYLQFGIMYYIR
jgi:hypothetical protein